MVLNIGGLGLGLDIPTVRNARRVTLKLRVQRALSTRDQDAVAAFASRAVHRWHRYDDEDDNWLEYNLVQKPASRSQNDITQKSEI